MSIALFVISEVLAPVQGLLHRLIQVLQHEHPTTLQTHPIAQEFETYASNVDTRYAGTPCKIKFHGSVSRPLKVIRILEPDHLPANVGRMMISGRMADVCAELDRLAACEQTVH